MYAGDTDWKSMILHDWQTGVLHRGSVIQFSLRIPGLLLHAGIVNTTQLEDRRMCLTCTGT
jgi:hypothetical protein